MRRHSNIGQSLHKLGTPFLYLLLGNASLPKYIDNFEIGKLLEYNG